MQSVLTEHSQFAVEADERILVDTLARPDLERDRVVVARFVDDALWNLAAWSAQRFTEY